MTAVRRAADDRAGGSVIALSWSDVDHLPLLVAWVAIGAVGAVAMARFGLPPVALHGPLHNVGVMDPLCGMTRAVRLLARGDLVNAWRYNPGVYLLAVGAVAVVVRWWVGTTTGRWARLRMRPAGWVLLVVTIVVLDVNQQLHVARLR